MSSATEQFRAGMDERGIEYMALNSVATDIKHDGMLTRVFDYGDDPDCQMCIETRCKTTKQAIEVIAATLGPGTCVLSVIDKGFDSASDWMKNRHWVFDEVYQCPCGCQFGMASVNRPNFCPACGKRVVEVEE